MARVCVRLSIIYDEKELLKNLHKLPIWSTICMYIDNCRPGFDTESYRIAVRDPKLKMNDVYF